MTCYDIVQDAVRARIEVVPVSGSGQRRASNIVKAGSSAGVTQVTSSDFRVPHQQSVILTYSKHQQNGEQLYVLLMKLIFLAVLDSHCLSVISQYTFSSTFAVLDPICSRQTNQSAGFNGWTNENPGFWMENILSRPQGTIVH